MQALVSFLVYFFLPLFFPSYDWSHSRPWWVMSCVNMSCLSYKAAPQDVRMSIPCWLRPPFLRCILLSLAYTSSGAPSLTEGYYPCASSPAHSFCEGSRTGCCKILALMVVHKSHWVTTWLRPVRHGSMAVDKVDVVVSGEAMWSGLMCSPMSSFLSDKLSLTYVPFFCPHFQ